MPLSFIPRRRMRASMALSIALLGPSCRSESGGSDGAASALVEQVKGVLAFQELHADDRRSDNPRCPLC